MLSLTRHNGYARRTYTDPVYSSVDVLVIACFSLLSLPLVAPADDDLHRAVPP
jgi:hypothetical protein